MSWPATGATAAAYSAWCAWPGSARGEAVERGGDEALAPPRRATALSGRFSRVVRARPGTGCLPVCVCPRSVHAAPVVAIEHAVTRAAARAAQALAYPVDVGVESEEAHDVGISEGPVAEARQAVGEPAEVRTVVGEGAKRDGGCRRCMAPLSPVCPYSMLGRGLCAGTGPTACRARGLRRFDHAWGRVRLAPRDCPGRLPSNRRRPTEGRSISKW